MPIGRCHRVSGQPFDGDVDRWSGNSSSWEFVLRWIRRERRQVVASQRDSSPSSTPRSATPITGSTCIGGSRPAVATRCDGRGRRRDRNSWTRSGSTLIYRGGRRRRPALRHGLPPDGVTSSARRHLRRRGPRCRRSARVWTDPGLGAAAEGDKTIVDALVPALQHSNGPAAGGETEEAARNAAEAANAGVEATLPLQARKGRASYLGSRSIGHQDPARRRPRSSSGRSNEPSVADGDRALHRGDRRGTIQSVDRAARILRVLGSSPRLGVTEISDRLGLAKATVHGLLRTLEQQELVEQDPETGKYRLGRGHAPARERVPGQPRATRSLPDVGRVAGDTRR